MSKKKIVFVIVEGPSDATAIGTFFDYLFDSSEVHVEVMHCDILTEYLFNNKPFALPRNKNILIELKNIIEAYLENNRQFKKSDISQIIHICDTDGCFAPDYAVSQDDSIKSIEYSETQIKVKEKPSFLKSKSFKADNINKLISAQYIWKDIPYRLYYMSTSIDHVLYNQLNLTDDEKENAAHSFVKQYLNNWNECKKLFSNSSFVVSGNYQETWEFIKKDLNSLKRYTNINQCFPKENK